MLYKMTKGLITSKSATNNHTLQPVENSVSTRCPKHSMNYIKNVCDYDKYSFVPRTLADWNNVLKGCLSTKLVNV